MSLSKNSSVKILFGKSLLLLILVILTHIGFRVIMPKDIYTYQYTSAVIDKLATIENTPSPRIILVGGSMLAFGVNSEKIQTEVGISIINFGTGAGLGLRFMLDVIKQRLLPGDIILIVPEYAYFWGGLDGDGWTISNLVEVYPRAMQYLTTKEQFVGLIMNYPNRLQEMVYKTVIKPPLSDIYYRDAFNEYGDVISHLGKPNREFPLSTYTKSNPREFPDVAITINLLNEFNDYAINNNLEVYFMYPAIIEETYLSNKNNFSQLHEMLEENLVIEVISLPEESAIPLEMFFNTNYHLNDNGREIFSNIIIEKLKPIIIRN